MNRFAIALAAVLALALGRPALADEPIVIKFSHVVAPDAPKGKAAIVFKELAEKYTNGRVKVEVYPNSSLYKDKEELEALQLGSVQLLAPSISKFGPLGVKEFDIFDLPFLMSDDAHARQMTASPMMGELNQKLEAKSVLPLAYWDNGATVYTANRPLILPEDFRGLKMRIQGGKVYDAIARELGALPQILPFSAVYQSLQTGVVDGEDNVPSNILTQKFYEVQKHLTVSYHGRITYALIANKTFWNSLPEDMRTQLDRAVKETTAFFNEVAAKDNADALDKIKGSGKTEMHVLTESEKKAWIGKLMPVHTQMQSRFGKDFIERIYKASGFTPPQS
jgi:C4-dicarboxylate-binding protein DctP